ncbi:hypothetical protein [Lyngbya sp. CCY1209]|uniref:hypothetical protein n=1 Tax=Lyngbya sp. CCY1209 TaxID=2886103 RepID=UPI002D20CB0A|nr:hypothetical protein [Lyngbya sp. CCY1209]MEB3884081.1 hypothetical protein [Lyngbya sp. CCY1209]
MPMNRKLYPRDWDDIARRVKDRVGWRCEECDRPCRRPGESWPELVERLYAIDFRWYAQSCEEVTDPETGGWTAVEKPGRFVLTAAHLDHDPQNCDPSNLRALCPACHLRHDLDHHIRTRRANRHRRREASGQLTLFDTDRPDPLR